MPILSRRDVFRAGAFGGAALLLNNFGLARALSISTREVPQQLPPVSLIGLPYLFGSRIPNAGYHMAHGPRVLLQKKNAPSAMRKAFSDVEVVMIEDADEPVAAEMGGDYRRFPVGDEWSRILYQNIRLAREVREARKRGRIVVASIGACSATLGMVGGLGDVEGNIGMIWFDAHSDAGTPETSANGFIEGMPVQMIAGNTWPNYRKQIPGFRTIPEERIIQVSLHEQFAPGGRRGAGRGGFGTLVRKPEIEQAGSFEAAMTHALDELTTKCLQVFVHIDTDVLDTSILRASTHSAVGGLTDVQVKVGLDLIAQRFEILAIDFASYDPVVDPRGPAILTPILVHAAQATALSRKPKTDA